MTRAIAVFTAGSSCIKFSLFVEGRGDLKKIIGEYSAAIREKVSVDAWWPGVTIEPSIHSASW